MVYICLMQNHREQKVKQVEMYPQIDMHVIACTQKHDGVQRCEGGSGVYSWPEIMEFGISIYLWYSFF